MKNQIKEYIYGTKKYRKRNKKTNKQFNHNNINSANFKWPIKLWNL